MALRKLSPEEKNLRLTNAQVPNRTPRKGKKTAKPTSKKK
jgi:hypothetical protein